MIKNQAESSTAPKDDDLHTLMLWCVVSTALAAFAKLKRHFGSAGNALIASASDWQALGLHSSHIKRFEMYKSQGVPKVFEQTLDGLAKGSFEIVYAKDAYFPKQLTELHDPPPLLFVRGDKTALSQAQIAIVGSRKPSNSAKDIAENFSSVLAAEGFWITSGLAEGIDKHAHIGALKLAKQTQSFARTVAVLGNGITHCYPRQNQMIYDTIIARGGAIVTEFLPDAKPMAHNFPRRNRLVSGLSLATLVVEAASKSGSLITANLAAEQGKLVFAIPSHIYNAGAKGCHELIRQGSILVDSPEHIIEDLNLPKRIHENNAAHNPNKQQNQESLVVQEVGDESNAASLDASIKTYEQTSNNALVHNDLPEHLQRLLNLLDWVGQDVDKLINTTGLDVASLSSQLMELELHGLIVQQGGLYMRCRPLN